MNQTDLEEVYRVIQELWMLGTGQQKFNVFCGIEDYASFNTKIKSVQMWFRLIYDRIWRLDTGSCKYKIYREVAIEAQRLIEGDMSQWRVA